MDVKQKEQVKRVALELIPTVISASNRELSERDIVYISFKIAKYFVETADALDYE